VDLHPFSLVILVKLSFPLTTSYTEPLSSLHFPSNFISRWLAQLTVLVVATAALVTSLVGIGGAF
jgi:hypothetical protein